jgi:hypothetical protein
MSSRPMRGPYAVIQNGDMSGNLTSEVTVIQNMSMMSYDVSWVGTAPVGTISVQVSNTYRENADGTVADPGDWTTLPLSMMPAVSGNAANGFIDIEALGAYAIRLVYNFTSGVGTMNVLMIGKVS